MLEVILIKSVANVGQAGQTVSVKDGYAKNFLLAKGYAVLPGSVVAKTALADQSKRDILKREQIETENCLAGDLNDSEIVINVRAGAGDRIFGSVTGSDVAKALGIDKKYVLLAKPLKTVGKHRVNLRFSSGATAIVNVTVAVRDTIGVR